MPDQTSGTACTIKYRLTGSTQTVGYITYIYIRVQMYICCADIHVVPSPLHTVHL